MIVSLINVTLSCFILSLHVFEVVETSPFFLCQGFSQSPFIAWFSSWPYNISKLFIYSEAFNPILIIWRHLKAITNRRANHNIKLFGRKIGLYPCYFWPVLFLDVLARSPRLSCRGVVLVSLCGPTEGRLAPWCWVFWCSFPLYLLQLQSRPAPETVPDINLCKNVTIRWWSFRSPDIVSIK